METTGTILSVTPRVAHDGGIMLQVNLEKSFVNPRSEDSNIPAEVRSAGTMTATLQSTVSLRDGETVVLGGFSSSSKPGQSQLVMLLTGRLARPEVPAGK
jgi:type II secretory pathway component GspD/PulD (secretin)